MTSTASEYRLDWIPLGLSHIILYDQHFAWRRLFQKRKKSYRVIFSVISCDSIMLSACRLVEKLFNMNRNEKVVLFSLQGLMCDTVNFILTSTAMVSPILKLQLAAGNIGLNAARVRLPVLYVFFPLRSCITKIWLEIWSGTSRYLAFGLLCSDK